MRIKDWTSEFEPRQKTKQWSKLQKEKGFSFSWFKKITSFQQQAWKESAFEETLQGPNYDKNLCLIILVDFTIDDGTIYNIVCEFQV